MVIGVLISVVKRMYILKHSMKFNRYIQVLIIMHLYAVKSCLKHNAIHFMVLSYGNVSPKILFLGMKQFVGYLVIKHTQDI